MSATLQGKERLQAQLGELASNASGSQLLAALMAGAQEIQSEAIRLVPKKTRTLSRSIHTEPVSASETSAEVQVGTDMVDAPIQEFGGFIRAKHKPYLVFQIDGQWVSVKSVYIPPQPYLRPALDTKREEVIKTVVAALMQLKK